MELKRRFERKVMKVSEMKFDTTNPNKMSKKEEEGLANSFDRFGYVDEIVIDKKTGMIADGEHRLKELIKKGVQDIEVKVLDFKDDVERRMYRQVSAKLHGTHDPVLDAEEFKKILENTDMEDFTALTGQSEQEILNILNSVEEQEIPKEADQVDQLGRLRVKCHKCGNEFERRED